MGARVGPCPGRLQRWGLWAAPRRPGPASKCWRHSAEAAAARPDDCRARDFTRPPRSGDRRRRRSGGSSVAGAHSMAVHSGMHTHTHTRKRVNTRGGRRQVPAAAAGCTHPRLPPPLKTPTHDTQPGGGPVGGNLRLGCRPVARCRAVPWVNWPASRGWLAAPRHACRGSSRGGVRAAKLTKSNKVELSPPHPFPHTPL